MIGYYEKYKDNIYDEEVILLEGRMIFKVDDIVYLTPVVSKYHAIKYSASKALVHIGKELKVTEVLDSGLVRCMLESGTVTTINPSVLRSTKTTSIDASRMKTVINNLVYKKLLENNGQF